MTAIAGMQVARHPTRGWRGALRGRRARLQPPLTPMIDIVFQLLLFFLLTMRFVAQEGQIPADLPAEQAPPAVSRLPLEPIVVSLSAGEDGGAIIEVTGYPLAVESGAALYGQLARLQEQFGSKEVPVVIRADADVAWAHVLDAYNQAVRLEFTSITLPFE